MCRWVAYSGAPVLLEDLLFKPQNSLIDQSMSSKSAETPTNGDGFGIGWYDSRPTPGLFRSIRPAWNDFNLRDLAAHIESPLFLAHVRATSQATVQETNCHPFRHKNWLFVHNGEIYQIEKFRKRLIEAISDELFPEVLGTTDSEIMFYLALTFGLESNPYAALTRMAGFVEHVGRAHGVSESLWMSLGLSDGKSLYVVRYASDGEAPSLFHSRDLEDVVRWNPNIRGQLRERFSDDTRLVVSEPAGTAVNLWVPVPQSTFIHIHGKEMEVQPFVPSVAAIDRPANVGV